MRVDMLNESIDFSAHFAPILDGVTSSWSRSLFAYYFFRQFPCTKQAMDNVATLVEPTLCGMIRVQPGMPTRPWLR